MRFKVSLLVGVFLALVGVLMGLIDFSEPYRTYLVCALVIGIVACLVALVLEYRKYRDEKFLEEVTDRSKKEARRRLIEHVGHLRRVPYIDRASIEYSPGRGVISAKMQSPRTFKTRLVRWYLNSWVWLLNGRLGRYDIVERLARRLCRRWWRQEADMATADPSCLHCPECAG